MKHRHPAVEQLEERCIPATWGNPWPDATNLTLSFARDGTLVGPNASTLQATLNTQTAGANWQLEILRAFQTWAVNANINIGLVNDSGAALGSPGRIQGDDRFGDIRLAGYNLGPDVLATASPFEATAGTWSGDVKINTSANWSVGGATGTDVFSALLHEAGHVFGLAHSEDSASPLFEDYQGVRTGLTAGDIANLQALYGARTADRYEGFAGNGTQSTATRLNLLTNSDGALGLAVDGDLGSLSDKDFFRFQAPLTLGALSINFQTAGLSLLTAKVTVLDANGRVVAASSASNPLNNDMTLRINSPTPLGTYYVKVEGAGSDVFNIGSYHLEVKSLRLVQSLTNTLTTTVNSVRALLSDDLHTNDSILTASLLPALTTRVDARFDYGFSGSIRDSWDVDYYRVRAPQAVAGTETVMAVMVWGLENDGLVPRASVYDSLGRAVAAEVLVNADGNFTVQVRNAVAGRDYFVKVEAATPRGANNTGNYFLGVDFSARAVQTETLQTGLLDASKPRTGGLLTVDASQMLNLVLSAEGAAGTVRLTVSDMSGQAIATLTATSGRDAVSLTQGLTQGRYLIRFEALAPDGSALGQMRFKLKGSRIDDPIGPRNETSTGTPSDSNSAPPPSSPPPTASPPPSDSTTAPPPESTTPPASPTPPPSQGQEAPPRPDGMTEEEYVYYSAYYWDWYYSNNANPETGDPYSDPYTVS